MTCRDLEVSSVLEASLVFQAPLASLEVRGLPVPKGTMGPLVNLALLVKLALSDLLAHQDPKASLVPQVQL